MEPTSELINFQLVLYSKYWNTPPYVEVSVDDEIKYQCKLTDEYTTINFTPLDGEYKNQPQYTYIASSIYGKWSIYWADDMEYDFVK